MHHLVLQIITHLLRYLRISSPVHSFGLDVSVSGSFGSSTRDVSPDCVTLRGDSSEDQCIILPHSVDHIVRDVDHRLILVHYTIAVTGSLAPTRVITYHLVLRGSEHSLSSDARDDTEEYEADASTGDTAEVGIDPMTAPLVEEEIVEPAEEDSPDSSGTRDGIVRSVEEYSRFGLRVMFIASGDRARMAEMIYSLRLENLKDRVDARGRIRRLVVCNLGRTFCFRHHVYLHPDHDRKLVPRNGNDNENGNGKRTSEKIGQQTMETTFVGHQPPHKRQNLEDSMLLEPMWLGNNEARKYGKVLALSANNDGAQGYYRKECLRSRTITVETKQVVPDAEAEHYVQEDSMESCSDCLLDEEVVRFIPYGNEILIVQGDKCDKEKKSKKTKNMLVNEKRLEDRATACTGTFRCFPVELPWTTPPHDKSNTKLTCPIGALSCAPVARALIGKNVSSSLIVLPVTIDDLWILQDCQAYDKMTQKSVLLDGVLVIFFGFGLLICYCERRKPAFQEIEAKRISAMLTAEEIVISLCFRSSQNPYEETTLTIDLELVAVEFASRCGDITSLRQKWLNAEKRKYYGKQKICMLIKIWSHESHNVKVFDSTPGSDKTVPKTLEEA
ncbi:hypothetical protein Tco_0973716 [Tanacetum coccineum]